MSWAVGYDERWKRDIGYGVPAICDHPGCGARIDRGLSYVCGSEPYGGDDGCGLYFCSKHLFYKTLRKKSAQVCERCLHDRIPFEQKPDVEEWNKHKATDPSWEAWREEQNFGRDLAGKEYKSNGISSQIE